jgi:hypothetical protein
MIQKINNSENKYITIDAKTVRSTVAYIVQAGKGRESRANPPRGKIKMQIFKFLKNSENNRTARKFPEMFVGLAIVERIFSS